MRKAVKTLVIMAVLFALSANTVNAQFLDKLKKSVEHRVEKTVINKTSDKAAQKTDKALESVMSPKVDGAKGAKKITPKNAPASFAFEYQYQLTMTTAQGKGKMTMDYFLTPGATYMGIKMNQGQDVFMVMDGQSNITYLFMNSGGNKIATATTVDGDDLVGEDSVGPNDYTITDLPDRTFLGYSCKGKKMENSEYEYIMYFTNKAPVSFNNVFKMDTDRIPAAIRGQFKMGGNVTMMYMEMKDKVNKGKKNTSGIMECTLIAPKKFTLDTSGYKFM